MQSPDFTPVNILRVVPLIASNHNNNRKNVKLGNPSAEISLSIPYDDAIVISHIVRIALHASFNISHRTVLLKLQRSDCLLSRYG